LAASGEAIRSGVQNRLWHQLQVVLLDGTTCRLRPLGDVPEHFAPHGGGNNRQPYWCLMRAVVVFCMATGVVLNCVTGATKRSEQALAQDLLLQALWVNTLLVGDCNFGVYSVVRAATHSQGHVLFRLTKARAKKLAGEASLELQAGMDQLVEWKPSAQDQCPDQLSREPVAGRLLALPIACPGFRPFTLYLFTTLVDGQITAEQLAECYGQRWQVELNLRYVKTQLQLEAFDCKSADIARKLWLGGLIAYNLVRAVMCAAAASTGQSVLRLSFTRTLKALRTWLPKAGKKGALKAWRRLLQRVAGFRLPKRNKPRPSEPRAKRYIKSDFPKLTGDRALARKKLRHTNLKS
jgi:hypothetical protein